MFSLPSTIQPVGRAVLYRMPDVTVAGNDAVALFLQCRGCLKELIPAGTDFCADDGGVIRAQYILGDGAAVDVRAAGCLIAQAHKVAIADGYRCLLYTAQCRQP